MRKRVIAGNWKMNKSPAEVETFMKTFPELVKDTKNEVILCVPFIDVAIALELAKNTSIQIGVQNMYFEESGAYTGEISPKMLEDIGVNYVIIGHSERRKYFHETDEMVNRKIKSALAHQLKPILCVGETLTQREEGKTQAWIIQQVTNALVDLTAEQVENLIIAYEPIWAIGTGKTATAEEANEAIHWIREEIEKLYGEEVAQKMILQYGGSVKASNAKELFMMPDIDGGLVGGASLDPVEFSKIVNDD